MMANGTRIVARNQWKAERVREGWRTWLEKVKNWPKWKGKPRRFANGIDPKTRFVPSAKRLAALADRLTALTARLK